MALTAPVTRREALYAGTSVCLAASLPSIGASDTVAAVVAEATRLPRAMRDGARPYSDTTGQEGHLPDNSRDYAVETARRSRSAAARARRLRATRFSPADRETLDTLLWDLERDVALAPFYYHEFPLGYSNSQLASLTLQFLAPPAKDEGDEYLARARQAPAYVDNIRLRLLGQLERHLTVPRAEGERALEQFRKESKEVAATLAAAAKGELRNSAFGRDLNGIVAGPLAAAFAALGETLERKYIPTLTDQSRVAGAEDSSHYFRELMNARLSDPLDMETMHEAAKQSLADADADLARIRRSVGGSVNAAEFHRSMAGNPRWFVKDAADLKARFDAAVAQVTPLVPRYFAHLPTTPFRVAPLPNFLADRLLNGYFSAPSKADPRGTYFYNTSHLDIANWAWVKPLVAHEIMPGHHLQAALLFERQDLSPYRRGVFVGAFAEGWGEYARTLMEEAGFYRDDPWGLYASRLVERRFALRTVVESGVHHPSWTWQKAAEELATDPLTRPETTRQLALAAASFRSTGALYWWGLRRFLRLRQLAHAKAAGRFDVCSFHARVMTGELLPFSVAERRILA